MASKQEGKKGTTSKCHLLDMAPEVRNRIYRHVLLSSHDIELKPGNFAQPGLLSTNKQIREESSPIYYHRNEFAVWIPDYDHRIMIAFINQAGKYITSRYGPGLMVEEVLSPGSSNWSNLLAWLEASYRQPMLHMGCEVGCKGYMYNTCCAASDAFKIVKTMGHMPWDTIEQVLMVHKDSSEREAKGAWQWT